MIDGHYLQLRAQLDELTRRQVVDDEVDKKRIADLREVTCPYQYLLPHIQTFDRFVPSLPLQVNDTLLRFARERSFQEDLARALVKVALDCWGGDTSKHSEAQLEAARSVST